VFAAATARATDLARGYLVEVGRLQERWRRQLAAAADPRSDAAAWVIIEVLPGFPVVTVSVAVAALEGSGRRRARAAVQLGIEQLVDAGVLLPVGASKRNRAWEAEGLLGLVSGLEAGEAPSHGADRVSDERRA